MCVGSCFPFRTTYDLNGHSVIEHQLNQANVSFRKDDNAFLAVCWLNRKARTLKRTGKRSLVKLTQGPTSYSAAIRSPLTPSAIRLPIAWSMFRQYPIARASTGSVTPFLRWPMTLETNRSRWALSMTLRTRVPA
jgi:hypothetical protein